MRNRMTATEKKNRKAYKLEMNLRKELASQISVIGFHRIFSYEGDDEGIVKNTEIKNAQIRKVYLEKVLGNFKK